MTRLLWPELEPEAVADGWISEAPPVKSWDVLSAIAKRHPMDGYGGEPGRWVFLREVSATTGNVAQRFDAVAVGLVPSVKYARVVYEVKVSRADWLRELKPAALVKDWYGTQLLQGKRAAAALAGGGDRMGWQVKEARKWDAALSVSTEFYIAAPPGVVAPDELPSEAGLVEVRLWRGELRPRLVRQAPVRDTPTPGVGFWSAVLRRTAGLRPPTTEQPEWADPEPTP